MRRKAEKMGEMQNALNGRSRNKLCDRCRREDATGEMATRTTTMGSKVRGDGANVMQWLRVFGRWKNYVSGLAEGVGWCTGTADSTMVASTNLRVWAGNYENLAVGFNNFSFVHVLCLVNRRPNGRRLTKYNP